MYVSSSVPSFGCVPENTKTMNKHESYKAKQPPPPPQKKKKKKKKKKEATRWDPMSKRRLINTDVAPSRHTDANMAPCPVYVPTGFKSHIIVQEREMP